MAVGRMCTSEVPVNLDVWEIFKVRSEISAWPLISRGLGYYVEESGGAHSLLERWIIPISSLLLNSSLVICNLSGKMHKNQCNIAAAL